MKTKIKLFDNQYLEKLIKKSKSIVAEKILFFLSFLESIIFPIPIDPLLAFLIYNNPSKFFRLTLFCTLASVIGGLFGWILGYILESEVEKLFNLLPWVNDNVFKDVKKEFNSHGILIVFLGAFTPLPFKIIAVSSGIFKVNLISFLLMSLFGRGLRFFIISFVVKKYGSYGINIIKNKILMRLFIVATILILFYVFFIL